MIVLRQPLQIGPRAYDCLAVTTISINLMSQTVTAVLAPGWKEGQQVAIGFIEPQPNGDLALFTADPVTSITIQQNILSPDLAIATLFEQIAAVVGEIEKIVATSGKLPTAFRSGVDKVDLSGDYVQGGGVPILKMRQPT